MKESFGEYVSKSIVIAFVWAFLCAIQRYIDQMQGPFSGDIVWIILVNYWLRNTIFK